MFDYISAIYYGDSFSPRPDSPLEHPSDPLEHTLLRRLRQVEAAMGAEFHDGLCRDLRVLLERRQAAA